jgi:hypothetical protein
VGTGDGDWTSQSLGLQGDGFGLCARRDGTGNVHFLFKPTRFNNDPMPAVYARWNGESFFREVIDSRTMTSGQLELTSDQCPIVMLQSLESGPKR